MGDDIIFVRANTCVTATTITTHAESVSLELLALVFLRALLARQGRFPLGAVERGGHYQYCVVNLNRLKAVIG